MIIDVRQTEKSSEHELSKRQITIELKHKIKAYLILTRHNQSKAKDLELEGTPSSMKCLQKRKHPSSSRSKLIINSYERQVKLALYTKSRFNFHRVKRQYIWPMSVKIWCLWKQGTFNELCQKA